MDASPRPVSLLRHALVLWRMRGPLWSFYRAHVIAAAVRAGLFEALREPATLAELARRLPAGEGVLQAWLPLLEKANAVRRRGDRFELTGWGRRHLLPESPYYLGYNLEEAVYVEGAFLARLPDAMTADKLPDEAPEAAVIGALSSIILEPFAFRVLDRLPVRRDGFRALDVGCGHGDYLRHLAQVNPSMTGVGVEITEGGAKIARERVQADGLSQRIRIVQADAREMELGEQFDLVMLNNNLYYFDPADWTALFSRLGKHLRDGGHLAVQTPLRDRRPDPLVDVFHLYLVGHRGLHGMARETDVRAALKEAGFARVKRSPLWPGAPWAYLVAQR